MSDFKHDYVRAYKTPLADADPARLRALFEEMSAAGRDTLAREGMTGEAVELRAALDLRYIGQWHELTVAVELPLDVDAAAAAFHAEHDRLFGHASPGAPVEVLALRLGAVGRTEKPELGSGPDDLEADARRGERPVWDPDERAFVPAPVWDGRTLPVSSTLTARRSSSSRAPRSSCRAASRSTSTPTARSRSTAASAAPRSRAGSRA